MNLTHNEKEKNIKNSPLSTCNVGDLGSIPGLGRSPGEYPLQYSGLKNSMDCIIHGVTKSRAWLSKLHFHTFKTNSYFKKENSTLRVIQGFHHTYNNPVHLICHCNPNYDHISCVFQCIDHWHSGTDQLNRVLWGEKNVNSFLSFAIV